MGGKNTLAEDRNGWLSDTCSNIPDGHRVNNDAAHKQPLRPTEPALIINYALH